MNQRGFWQLGGVSDERLLGRLQELLVTEGGTEARIVAHLAELDARRLHLKHAESLFRYCQKRLGLSDSQAYYRIAAARIARKFPVVFGMLERREIHLTNLAPLSARLTAENHLELLREAGRLSKRKLLEVLARRWPSPNAQSSIRRLVPAPGAVSAGPTGSLQPLSEDHYRLQLNTSEALKQKLELARDLMSHANPTGDLAVVVERALDVLIEKLQKRRFGQTSRPRRPAREAPRVAEELHRRRQANVRNAQAAATPASEKPDARPGTRVLDSNTGMSAVVEAHGARDPDGSDRFDESERFDRPKGAPLKARAHIPNETRRQLVARDGLCCSYVSEDGQRCNARCFLQIHHERAWANGGPDTLDNLRLFCASHNQLRAEQEYGVRHVERAMLRARAESQRRDGQ